MNETPEQRARRRWLERMTPEQKAAITARLWGPVHCFEQAVAVARRMLTLIEKLTRGNIAVTLFLNTPERDQAVFLQALIEAAETIPGAHDGLKEIAAMYLEADQDLPNMLQKWLAANLRGKRPRPGKRGRGRDSAKMRVRHEAIRYTIRYLVDQGMTANQAQEAVAEGISRDVETVKSIWKRRTR